jgi:hypothetical protein
MSDGSGKEIISEEDKQKQFNIYFQEIEDYFKKKERFIIEYRHIPLEEILENAPKYYLLISVIERINVFLSKKKDWLLDFVKRNNIKFDHKAYEKWKGGREFRKFRYTDTRAPSKWVHVLQDNLIQILEYLQILLIMEFNIDPEDYKKFLDENKKIKFKLHLNYKRTCPPSENIADIFQLIDYLLQVSVQEDFTKKFVIDTALCMKIYREIDTVGIMDLLKQKQFYIKYRLEYLRGRPAAKRAALPYESEVIRIAEDFNKAVSELIYTYNEYKTRLLNKYESAMRKFGGKKKSK